MADLLTNPIITGDGVDTITVPSRGRYLLSIGFGALNDPDDADSENFEDADVTVKLGGWTVEDGGGNALSAITAGKLFAIDLPPGVVLEFTTANTTSACRITVELKLLEAFQTSKRITTS